MNIFFQLVYSWKAYGEVEKEGFNGDHRFWIGKQIGDILLDKGHNVYILKMNYPCIKGLDMSRYNRVKKMPNVKFDMAIAHADLKYCRTFLKENFKEYPKACFDYSFLPESMIFDAKGLFDNSINYDKMQTILDNVKIPDTLQYCNDLVNSNISKRVQEKKDKIPRGKYIFVPGQVLNDRSIMKHSRWHQFTFIEQVIKFGLENKLQVVFKPHPGLRADVKKHGKLKFAEKIIEWKKLYKNFHVVNTSIYDLMKQAEFTACINSGSVIDNFVTQTPVLCAGRMYWTKTNAVVHNENLLDGLKQMLNRDYDLKKMKKTQLQAVQWCRENLLFKNLTAQENFRRFKKLTGFDL